MAQKSGDRARHLGAARAKCARLVEQAIKLGYRHIDTAQVYENEREVGEGLRASGVRRDDVFVTTKVWTTHFAPNDLERSAKESLAKLRLSEVDLCCCTGPIRRCRLQRRSARSPMSGSSDGEAHRRLEFHGGFDRRGGCRLFPASGVRSGRVSSLSRPDQSAGGVRAHGLALVAYSPIAKGRIKGDALLAGSAGKYRKTAAQVCLRWLVQQNVIAIPRTSKIERLSENIDIFDFELSGDEMQSVFRLGSAGNRLTDFGFAPKWD